MDNEESIKDKLDKLVKQNENLVSEKKEKKWKLPWGKTPSRSQINKGWITVQVIRNNGAIDFIKAKIDDGTVTIDGLPRIATIDNLLTYRGKTWLIMPEWSIKPFSPTENYNQMVAEKNTTIGWRLIQAKLEKEAIKPSKAGFGNMGWIILVIVAAGIGYYLYTGGKLF